jgi:phage baseplate assembly protein W
MADISLEWNADFALTADGDLMLVDGSDETRQSIIRRLLTNAGSYIWATEYGASLPARIGRVAREKTIAAIVRAQIALEATVASVPVPKTTVTASTATAGLFAIDIQYTDAVTGAAIAVSLETPGSR